jgi:hypothetical protein
MKYLDNNFDMIMFWRLYNYVQYVDSYKFNLLDCSIIPILVNVGSFI